MRRSMARREEGLWPLHLPSHAILTATTPLRRGVALSFRADRKLRAMSKPITSMQEAQDKLDRQIEDVEKEIAIGASMLDDVTREEEEEVNNRKTVEELMSMNPRQWSISQLGTNRALLKRLKETKKEELIFPHGRYLMVPKGTQLLSPSGFRCDEQVFIKPESGCLVDVLPKSSNMGYYDFTT